MSHRKTRQQKRQFPEDTIANEFAAWAMQQPLVHAIESEFQGDWNTLGFTLKISERANVFQLADFYNKIIGQLQTRFSEAKASSKWSVGIYRNEELIEALYPGDKPRKIYTVCEQSCDKEQPCCPYCRSPFPDRA